MAPVYGKYIKQCWQTKASHIQLIAFSPTWMKSLQWAHEAEVRDDLVRRDFASPDALLPCFTETLVVNRTWPSNQEQIISLSKVHWCDIRRACSSISSMTLFSGYTWRYRAWSYYELG